MPKAFPVVDIRCSECPRETQLVINYESEEIRFAADTIFLAEESSDGWQISSGRDTPDYCPVHTKLTKKEEKENK